MIQTEKPAYSRIQHIMWLIAGSEISILKKCTTDYNRHAGIGFTILMTCVFAFFAGGYAGYFFSGNIAGGLLFGCIWMLLVFSIDRMMVTSLKKDPNRKRQVYIWPLLMRLVLSGLIAFIISIPLELLVFSKNIDKEMPEYRLDQLARLQRKGALAYNTAGDSSSHAYWEKKLADAHAQSNSDPDTKEFKDGMGVLEKQKTIVAEKKQMMDRAAAALGQSFTSREEKERARATYQRRKKEYNAAAGVLRQVNNELEEMRNVWHRKKEEDYEKADTNVKQLDDRISTTGSNLDSSRRSLDFAMKDMEQSFIVRFDVLHYAAYKKDPVTGKLEKPSMVLFIWLIRILLLVIELLPSVVKITMPLGAYDWAMNDHEQSFIAITLKKNRELLQESTDYRIVKELEARARQVDYRIRQHGLMQERIVDKVIAAQEAVAEQILKAWQEEHTSKLENKKTRKTATT